CATRSSPTSGTASPGASTRTPAGTAGARGRCELVGTGRRPGGRAGRTTTPRAAPGAGPPHGGHRPQAPRRRLVSSPSTAEAIAMTTQDRPTIHWTKVDEAPALATYSLLPIVRAYAAAA